MKFASLHQRLRCEALLFSYYTVVLILLELLFPIYFKLRYVILRTLNNHVLPFVWVNASFYLMGSHHNILIYHLLDAILNYSNCSNPYYNWIKHVNRTLKCYNWSEKTLQNIWNWKNFSPYITLLLMLWIYTLVNALKAQTTSLVWRTASVAGVLDHFTNWKPRSNNLFHSFCHFRV